jgi:phytoene desaturase
MQKIGTNKGAKFHLGTEVDQIMVENGVGKGFRLADGTEHHFDRIILNTDFGHLVNHNIDPEDTKRYTREKVNGMKYSCSTFMLYLGLDRKVDLPHHTIFFAEKYRECVEDVFDHLQLPEGISFYVRNADINDSTLSPEGHSSLYVLVPVPNLRAEIDWEKEKGPFRERVLQELEERGEIQGIRDHIKEEIVITPIDWQEKMNVHFGATFNLAHNLKQVACFRPPNIYCDFSNTYLVGGGTHPGSGLPTIYQSAKIAAEAINST